MLKYKGRGALGSSHLDPPWVLRRITWWKGTLRLYPSSLDEESNICILFFYTLLFNISLNNCTTRKTVLWSDLPMNETLDSIWFFRRWCSLRDGTSVVLPTTLSFKCRVVLYYDRTERILTFWPTVLKIERFNIFQKYFRNSWQNSVFHYVLI